MRIAALIIALVTAAGPSRAAALAADSFDPGRPGVMVRLPDGRRLNFRCMGAGRPTVVMEGGFAATAMAWFKVAALVAPKRRVCAYDRAGAGFSDPGQTPRDGAAIARDLDQGLRALHIPGPYILVGHSTGGLYARAFADRRPSDVAGMVLADPSVEYQDRRFAALFGPGAGSVAPQRARAARCQEAADHALPPFDDPVLMACLPAGGGPDTPDLRRARIADALRRRLWAMQISELDTLWGATSDEIAAGRGSYGVMPLIVLTADGTYAGAPVQARPEVDALWRRLHQELAARSRRGRERLVDHSSHLMMLDRPDAIATAIDEVAGEIARERGRQ